MRSLLRSELIGLPIRVVNSKNGDLIGLSGEIVDETKYTIIVKDGDKQRRLLKGSVTMELIYLDKRVRVEGGLLIGRPEDRIKK
ncbi:MAG: ribonuclease P protein subunit [archaeon]